MTEAYPLQWPAHRPRRIAAARKNATFNTKTRNGRWTETKALTIADALGRLQAEIEAIGGKSPVLSSDLERRLDGLPRSGQREPIDPGVCLYFQLRGKPVAMPCDTYTRAADNIAAIAAHIEATRKIARHGVATVADMFAGFEALPAPGAPRPWRVVLGFTEGEHLSASEINAKWRVLAAKHHPDTGGSHDAMAEINEARGQALREIGGDA